MRLPALLAEEARRFPVRQAAGATGEAGRVLNLQDVTIKGFAADSRMVEPGQLFAALSGTQADGHIFIPEALKKGAVAVLGSSSAEAYAQLVAGRHRPDPRRRLAQLAASFYRCQPAFTAAVTGTNGKTSIASFTRQIWDRLGIRAASLGTLGLESAGRWPKSSLTTPDAITLHRLAAELAKAGVDLSSSRRRARPDPAGWRVCIHAAAFSNITATI